MLAQSSQSTEHWAWTDESRYAYEWAVRRLFARGLKGCRILDVGCGTGIGTAALQEAGFDVSGIDSCAEAVEMAQAAGVKATLAHWGGRKDIRARDKWDAITMFGIVGYYSLRDRNAVEDAMRLAPVVLMSTIRRESEFEWMKPLPSYDGSISPALVEWSR